MCVLCVCMHAHVCVSESLRLGKKHIKRKGEENLRMKAQQWKNKEDIPLVKIFYAPKLMEFRAICLVRVRRV